MPQQVTAIKKRIASIKGAYKITSAMKLVSTVKLKKWRKTMLENKEYSDEIISLTSKVLSCSEKVKSPYFEPNTKANKKLYIIISSTLGLCGSYNNNMLRLADANILPNDDLLILGGKALIHYADKPNTKVKGFEEITNLSSVEFQKQLLNLVTKEYLDGTYSEIHLIYSEYVNALIFKAKDALILPIPKIEADDKGIPPLLEPNPQALVDKLVPLYLMNSLRSKILESEVCEQASRSNAMENATKNAEDLLDTLSIEFNKARQGAITQEIIEIVGAANDNM